MHFPHSQAYFSICIMFTNVPVASASHMIKVESVQHYRAWLVGGEQFVAIFAILHRVIKKSK